jgi:hypothetical protein
VIPVLIPELTKALSKNRPMTLLDRLEKSIRPVAIPNITLYLIFGQVFAFGASFVGQFNLIHIALHPTLVLEGQIWRVVTFLFVPPVTWHPVLIAFAWYIFYLMGNALEQYWGTARYNLFLLIGWAATVLVAFVPPFGWASNSFLAGTVFLAFAWLNPNFQLMLFFVLPVKVKWLALLAWLGYAFSFIVGPMTVRLSVLAAVFNFLLFFGQDINLLIKNRKRQRTTQVERERLASEPHHTCLICGKTDQTDPREDFRYCSKCAGAACYCQEHLHSHQHRDVDPDE